MRSLRIRISSAAPAGSRKGNRVTAERWARLLRRLGHRVAVEERYSGAPCDLLVALHARKAAGPAAAYRDAHPSGPLAVALTGTDIYVDVPANDAATLRTLDAADVLIGLHALTAQALPRRFRRKVRVILQSATGPRRGWRDWVHGTQGAFDVAVLAHLRAIKDPFRAAEAAALLPPTSRVRVLHLGGELEPGFAARARAEAKRNPRYEWRGSRPHAEAMRVLSGCRALVISSRSEAGPGVLSEALALGVPVLAARIPGLVGVLGRGYPGYFRTGDTASLARLLRRAEADARLYARLERWCARLRPQVAPERELAAWRSLLRDMGLSPARRERRKADAGVA